MILGAGPLQLPAIQVARELGIRTIALDQNKHAIGLQLCDKYYVVDILNVKRVLQIAVNERIDGVMTLCTDAPVRTVAAVGQALGLPVLSNIAAGNATDKRLMRRSFQEHDAPSPQNVQVNSQTEALAAARRIGYPLAIKIGRGSGSRGIYRVENDAELQNGFAECRGHQGTEPLLVEEWIDGEEISVEGYCTDGEIRIIAITDKSVFPGQHPVESGHCQPSKHPIDTQARIHRAVTLGVQALGLTWCMFHAEVKLSPFGPQLIEIGARLGGDRIATHLTPLATGVNMVCAAILLSLGERVDPPHLFQRGSCIRYFNAQRTGRLREVRGLNSICRLPGSELIYAASEKKGELKEGFIVRSIRSSLDRYGHILFSGENREQAVSRCDQALRTLRFEFTDGKIRDGLGNCKSA